MLLTQAASERTIDPEFDQTAIHVHGKDKECPTCRAVQTYHTPTKIFSGGNQIELVCDFGERVDEGNDADAGSREQFARPVSPSILEHRIQILERANHKLIIDLGGRDLRIKQMEALMQTLAGHLDECLKLIAPVRKPQGQFPKAA